MGRANQPTVDPIERTRELTWAVVDENLEDSDWSELQSLLIDSSEARFAYIEAMQLHTDLLFHFQDQRPAVAGAKPQTTVLGFLGDPAAISSPLEVGG